MKTTSQRNSNSGGAPSSGPAPTEVLPPAPGRRPAFRVEWAILAFCAWRSADLLQAWQHSPYDKVGWLAFALGCLPLGWVCLRRRQEDVPEQLPWLPWLAVALGLIGSLGHLNFLTYWGLACAVVALRRNSWKSLPWLALALCWMPVLGWAAARFSPTTVSGLRLALATLAVVAGSWGWRRRL